MEQLSFSQTSVVPQAAVSPVRASISMRREDRRDVSRHSAPALQGQGNVTEIILPEAQVENFQLLLPMLTQLNQEKRWLAWIDPPQAVVTKWQNMRGIVAGELLVLRSTPEFSATELAEMALRTGTCHAVVMWTTKLSRSTFSALEKASAQGNSHGVVLRKR